MKISTQSCMQKLGMIHDAFITRHIQLLSNLFVRVQQLAKTFFKQIKIGTNASENMLPSPIISRVKSNRQTFREESLENFSLFLHSFAETSAAVLYECTREHLKFDEPTITVESLKNSAHELTEFLLRQLEDFFASRPFHESFDFFVHQVIAPHIKDFLIAEKNTRGNNHVFMQAFSELPSCTSQIKQLIEEQLRLAAEGKDFTSIQASFDKKLFMPIADKFISIMNQETLNPLIIERVSALFNRMVSPAHIDKTFADHIFPAINIKLLMTFIKHEMSVNSAAFAPIFAELLKANSDQRKAHLILMQTLLMKMTKAKCDQFTGENFYIKENRESGGKKLVLNHLTTEDWMNFSESAVISFEKKLLESPLYKLSKTLSTAEIARVLEGYSKQSTQAVDPVLGEIFINLIFKMGELPHPDLIGFFIRDNINDALTTNTREMRRSPDFLVKKLTSFLKRRFPDQESIRNFWFNDNLSPTLTTEKLALRLKTTSCLAYDLLQRFAEQKGSLVSFIARKAIYISEINLLLNRLYNKTFRNKILNLNLLSKVIGSK